MIYCYLTRMVGTQAPKLAALQIANLYQVWPNLNHAPPCMMSI